MFERGLRQPSGSQSLDAWIFGPGGMVKSVVCGSRMQSRLLGRASKPPYLPLQVLPLLWKTRGSSINAIQSVGSPPVADIYYFGHIKTPFLPRAPDLHLRGNLDQIFWKLILSLPLPIFPFPNAS